MYICIRQVIIYMLLFSKFIKQFPNINYVIYADDIQLYWKVPTCSINVPNKLTLCARNVRGLFSITFFLPLLKLNYLILPLHILFVLLLPSIILLPFQVIMLYLFE